MANKGKSTKTSTTTTIKRDKNAIMCYKGRSCKYLQTPHESLSDEVPQGDTEMWQMLFARYLVDNMLSPWIRCYYWIAAGCTFLRIPWSYTSEWNGSYALTGQYQCSIASQGASSKCSHGRWHLSNPLQEGRTRRYAHHSINTTSKAWQKCTIWRNFSSASDVRVPSFAMWSDCLC